MDNQHRIIKTYRELSQADIDLMNRVKAHEAVTAELLKDVRKHLEVQAIASMEDMAERERIERAEPYRWTAIAKTDFQTACMALVRSIAQPDAPM